LLRRKRFYWQKWVS